MQLNDISKIAVTRTLKLHKVGDPRLNDAAIESVPAAFLSDARWKGQQQASMPFIYQEMTMDSVSKVHVFA